MKKFIYIFSMLLLLIAGGAFAQKRTTKYIPVPVEKADKILAKKNLVVLDVRTPEETALGQLPNAITIDFKKPGFKEQISALPKNKPYFVYCRSGNRSGKTVELMKSLGFRKVYELQGGYQAYEGLKNNKE